RTPTFDCRVARTREQAHRVGRSCRCACDGRCSCPSSSSRKSFLSAKRIAAVSEVAPYFWRMNAMACWSSSSKLILVRFLIHTLYTKVVYIAKAKATHAELMGLKPRSVRRAKTLPYQVDCAANMSGLA